MRGIMPSARVQGLEGPWFPQSNMSQTAESKQRYTSLPWSVSRWARAPRWFRMSPDPSRGIKVFRLNHKVIFCELKISQYQVVWFDCYLKRTYFYFGPLILFFVTFILYISIYKSIAFLLCAAYLRHRAYPDKIQDFCPFDGGYSVWCSLIVRSMADRPSALFYLKRVIK